MNATKIALKQRPGRFHHFCLPAQVGLILAGLVWIISSNVVRADDSTNAPVAKTTAPPTAAKLDQGAPAKPAKKKISGVELYAIHCNRCHAERYPVEFNETQWKTLMLHMRVRANLPAGQAREILKYLQDEAGY